FPAPAPFPAARFAAVRARVVFVRPPALEPFRVPAPTFVAVFVGAPAWVLCFVARVTAGRGALSVAFVFSPALDTLGPARACVAVLVVRRSRAGQGSSGEGVPGSPDERACGAGDRAGSSRRGSSVLAGEVAPMGSYASDRGDVGSGAGPWGRS